MSKVERNNLERVLCKRMTFCSDRRNLDENHLASFDTILTAVYLAANIPFFSVEFISAEVHCRVITW